MATQRMRRVDEIGEESRRRILDAAEELFAEKGVDRTSFVDIAERSGISRGSIPWHFKNKDGLVLAVVERALSRETAVAMPSDAGNRDLDAVFDSIQQWMHRPTAAMLYTVMAHALSTDGDVARSYREFNVRRRKAARRIVAQDSAVGAAAGADAEVLAAVLNGAFIGLHLQWILDPTVDLDAGLDALKRLIAPGQDHAGSAPVKRRRRRA